MNVGEGETRCYWMEPTGDGKVGLRRFTFGSENDGCRCSSGNGHDASVMIDEFVKVEIVKHDDGWLVQRDVPDDAYAHDDPRWPHVCESCGESFPDDARWQTFCANGYVRSDTGETVYARHLHGVEWAGALYDAPWLHGKGGEVAYRAREHGDGIILICVCPNGHPWVVDGQATGGGYWERTGDPRKPETLTANPSIAAGDPAKPGYYHGWLRNGVLTAHIG